MGETLLPSGELPTGPVALLVEVLPHGVGLPLPARATLGAAGLDLVAALAEGSQATLAPGERLLIPTGLKMAIPQGYEGQVRPRSGLALRHGVTVLNAPGTIDSDYRGEVQVLLVNLGKDTVMFRRGDRIAQFLVAPVIATTLSTVKALDESTRGARGFGSTGISVAEMKGGEKT